MMSKIANRLSSATKSLNLLNKRNIGISSVVMNKTDPIQQIFLDKSKEYYQKKR
jgi:Mrp family chromosome partitioning ATPase